MKLKSLLFIFLSVVGVLGAFFLFSTKTTDNVLSKDAAPVAESIVAVKEPVEDKGEKWMQEEINAIESQAKNISDKVLKTSLIAYQHAQEKGVTHSPLLTIVDYSKPSSERRIWVVDLDKKKVLFNTWVAHGKNSGEVNATSFSNQPESLKSSIGVFVTGDVYEGKHGNSLHVQGLEKGINDNAYDRSIVFHGASYVSPGIAKSGRIGRSWGCLAVSEDIIPSLIKTIKNQVLVVAYYPDQKWLNHSTYLN